ncbi:zinc-binding dehydrogenase [Microbispora sp. NBC_01189]|uniref:quinone oxidoreductase family protein n=1 Tax=Microbispora sp. NBC_01189 TaxID=2903583 RepID=UPI002E0D2822|nr:zinc-binding dehydrogenase [Microbispora sp. NBC_01189]
MRAIVMHKTGGPEVLTLEEVPTPVPGPGQVLVRTEAVGVTYYETAMRSGLFPMSRPLPSVFGFEAAGVVAEVGEGVDDAGADGGLTGRRVAIMNATGGGTYAEYVTAAADALVPVPDSLTAADAVAVAVQGALAMTLLRTAGLTGTETVLAEVAGGGVGGYLTQLARPMGAARVLATGGSPAKRGLARELGADDVFDHTDPGWTERLREAGGPVDVVFESLGGVSAGRVLDAMTPGTGRMLLYGLLGGPPAVSPMDLLQRGLTLVGCGGPEPWLSRVLAARAEVLDLAARGGLRPQVDSVLPLADAAEAHRRIEARAAVGKVVLVP